MTQPISDDEVYLDESPALFDEEGGEDYDDGFDSLIPVNDHQVACSGSDLIDMLNFDEAVDEAGDALFQRLGLTYTLEKDDCCDFELRRFNELSEDAYYLITFSPQTDLEDFSMVDARSIEEISEQCYCDLADAANETPCDGNCDECDQDCIGKQPIE